MQESVSYYHRPVLFEESLNGLNIQPDGVYVDVTFGGGSHSRGILQCLGNEGRLYAFDQDADAEANIPADSRFTFVRSNFRYLSNFMRYHGVKAVDGILADLGVSSHHFDNAARGFSFRFNGELDMRMNNRNGKTATDILNTYSEADLSDIFFTYGELQFARRLASHIVAARTQKPIQTSEGLLEVVKPFIHRDKEKQTIAQVFQSLRIETNSELDSLNALLRQTVSILKPGGRCVVITYHSLEDRMVKNFFRSGNQTGENVEDLFGNRITPFKPVNNKVITPSTTEIASNPRARSAKLRIAEKK
ncbi:MAG: 16S rRNA (cytosine(1402)-N(4))-methyltransferase RsmH [Tannerella sp.]|jgi:16S rRNA (cytosine1402-N4)-methyltransferase|nr:16S rRNA (cytosine(1402)-N(4))-methyltransferase RsmH [Tannerella sp.]